MKDYIVWYKECEDSPDVVRGMSRNYRLAEEMAHALYLEKISYKQKIFSSGVTRLSHGELYKDNECSLRWTVICKGSDVRNL